MYTFEDDLFYKPRKRKRRGWGRWVFAVVVALLFVYSSVRTVKRLRANPPRSFYDYSLTRNKEDRQHERHVAQAYWQVAVRRIQTHYAPKVQLPSDPPPSFRIGGAAGLTEKDAVASRTRYWYRLREVWGQSDAWVVSYRWDTDWVEHSLNSLERNGPRWLSEGIQTAIGWLNSIAQRSPFS